MASRLLQVGTKIIGVGRNYAAHAKELGNAVPKVPSFYFSLSSLFRISFSLFNFQSLFLIVKEPVLFLKPTSSYLENGGTIEIPHPLESLDHEVELAVIISKKARDVPQAKAMEYVGGNCLLLVVLFTI